MKRTFTVVIGQYGMVEYYDTYEVVAESQKEAEKLAMSGDLVSVDEETNYDIEISKELIKKLHKGTEPIKTVYECYESESKDKREARILLERQKDLLKEAEELNEKIATLNNKP